MNKQQIIGFVQDVVVKTGINQYNGTQGTMILFGLRVSEKSVIPCRISRDEKLFARGMKIELTSYMPVRNVGKDKLTNQWREKFLIQVDEYINLSHPQYQPEPKQQQMIEKFDINSIPDDEPPIDKFKMLERQQQIMNSQPVEETYFEVNLDEQNKDEG